jgi:hypothetical protein
VALGTALARDRGAEIAGPCRRPTSPGPAANAPCIRGVCHSWAAYLPGSLKSGGYHDDSQVIATPAEPTVHRRKVIQFCEELIARGLPDKVQWGIYTRVTDILRDGKLLPIFRQAGLVHVSLSTEAAAQLKLERFLQRQCDGDAHRADHSRQPEPHRAAVTAGN